MTLSVFSVYFSFKFFWTISQVVLLIPSANPARSILPPSEVLHEPTAILDVAFSITEPARLVLLKLITVVVVF